MPEILTLRLEKQLPLKYVSVSVPCKLRSLLYVTDLKKEVEKLCPKLFICCNEDKKRTKVLANVIASELATALDEYIAVGVTADLSQCRKWLCSRGRYKDFKEPGDDGIPIYSTDELLKDAAQREQEKSDKKGYRDYFYFFIGMYSSDTGRLWDDALRDRKRIARVFITSALLKSIPLASVVVNNICQGKSVKERKKRYLKALLTKFGADWKIERNVEQKERAGAGWTSSRTQIGGVKAFYERFPLIEQAVNQTAESFGYRIGFLVDRLHKDFKNKEIVSIGLVDTAFRQDVGDDFSVEVRKNKDKSEKLVYRARDMRIDEAVYGKNSAILNSQARQVLPRKDTDGRYGFKTLVPPNWDSKELGRMTGVLVGLGNEDMDGGAIGLTSEAAPVELEGLFSFGDDPLGGACRALLEQRPLRAEERRRLFRIEKDQTVNMEIKEWKPYFRAKVDKMTWSLKVDQFLHGFSTGLQAAASYEYENIKDLEMKRRKKDLTSDEHRRRLYKLFAEHCRESPNDIQAVALEWPEQDLEAYKKCQIPIQTQIVAGKQLNEKMRSLSKAATQRDLTRNCFRRLRDKNPAPGLQAMWESKGRS